MFGSGEMVRWIVSFCVSSLSFVWLWAPARSYVCDVVVLRCIVVCLALRPVATLCQRWLVSQREAAKGEEQKNGKWCVF